MNFEFPFLSQNTFLNAPAGLGRGFTVAGIPYDGAVTNRPGARFATDAIRRASHMFCDATHDLFDVSPCAVTGDAGDFRLPLTALADMRAALLPQAVQLLQRSKEQQSQVVWLGGDHSVTLPLLRAYRQVYGQPLALVHFDAHCDTWKDHFGEPSGHGTWVYEAVQEGLVLPHATVQIGIRSAGVREAREYVNDIGGRVFTARQLRGCENAQQLAFVTDDIKQRLAAAGHPPVYLTFDIDAIDPAFAPGTGTPEAGGLTSAQALTLVEALSGDAALNFVGMDMVEVAPAYDHADLTTLAAASLVLAYMSGRMACGAVVKA